MKKILMIASAAAMAISMPALAQGQGKGKGASAKQSQSQSMKRNAKSTGQVRTDVRARTDARANVRAKARTGATIDRLDVNRDGRVDSRDSRLDRNRDGLNDRLCPPGLAKKTPACVPPGQAKRMFNQGQRVPTNFRDFRDFNDVTSEFGDRIPAGFRTDQFGFIVRDDSIFVVDRTTRVVRSIIDVLAR